MMNPSTGPLCTDPNNPIQVPNAADPPGPYFVKVKMFISYYVLDNICQNISDSNNILEISTNSPLIMWYYTAAAWCVAAAGCVI